MSAPERPGVRGDQVAGRPAPTPPAEIALVAAIAGGHGGSPLDRDRRHD